MYVICNNRLSNYYSNVSSVVLLFIFFNRAFFIACTSTSTATANANILPIYVTAAEIRQKHQLIAGLSNTLPF